MDKFRWFCLSQEDKAFLEQYRSPQWETSIFKQIPIEYLDRVKRTMRFCDLAYRIVYRGPRTREYDPSITYKKDAQRFSVYVRG